MQYPPTTADEYTTLTTFLDFFRESWDGAVGD